MKKKLRNINVNGKKYHWSVSSPNCDGDGGAMFKIFYEKKLIYADLIHGIQITPNIVREKILKLNNG